MPEDFSAGAPADSGVSGTGADIGSSSGVSDSYASQDQGTTEGFVAGTAPDSVEAPTQDTPSYEEQAPQETALQFGSLEEAMAHIGTLNQQITEAQPYAEINTRLEQYGGIDSVEPLLQLAGNLFAPMLNEAGEQVIDPRTGQLEYTSAPFVEQLSKISPSILYEMTMHSLDAPYGNTGESLGHAICRDVLGINPDLIETYQQIQSLEQAQPFLRSQSPVDASELEGIPAQFQEAYKTYSPKAREEIQLLEEDSRNEVLGARDQALKAEQRQAENDKYIAEQRETQKRDWHARVEQRGNDIIDKVTETTVTGALNELKTKANFFGNESDNQIIWGEIINSARNKVSEDPALQMELQRAQTLYKNVAYNQAIGEQWQAQQLQIEADRIAKKLEKRFRDEVTRKASWWSSKLGATRQQQAQPRIEIGQKGTQSTPGQAPAQPASERPSNGQRFQVDPAMIAKMASDLAMRRAGH